jgi:hypothetical protein
MTERLSVVVLVIAATFAAAPAVAQEPAGKPVASGKPADLCQELLAFVKPPAPANPPATTPVAPQQQSAVSAPTGKADEKSGGAAGAVQQNSGLSSPVTADSAASPQDARAAANTAAKSPAAAAAAAAPTKPSPEAVAQAEAAVAANDPAGCRASVQTMRRAGVTIPSPLLALGALDLKFYAAN